MNKFFKKIICILGFLALLSQISGSNSAQFLESSNESKTVIKQFSVGPTVKQEKFLKEQFRSIYFYTYGSINDSIINNFSSYKYYTECISECLKFPMFYNIHEDMFPEILVYLRPTKQSKQVLTNFIRVQSFFSAFYQSILDVYKELNNMFNSKFFQLESETPSIIFENISDQLETIPEESSESLDIPKIINPIDSVDQINFSYGLSKFKEFTETLGSDEKLFSIMNNLNKQFVKFLENIGTMNKSIRSLWLSFNDFDSLEEESELVRLLFVSIFDMSKMVSDSFHILNIIYKLPSDLIDIYERLSLANVMRSNFMEKVFGPNFERKSVIIPDITSVLSYMKKELNLLNNNQAMELFSYIANLQFLIHPIGDYQNNISTEELIEFLILISNK